MVTHSDEEVKEHLTTLLHLRLHCATSLEGGTTADDESEVVSTKLGIIIRGMAVCPPSGCKDGTNLNS